MARRNGEVSVRWAARVLEISEKTIRRWIIKHKIKHRKDLGGRIWLVKPQILKIARAMDNVDI